MVSAAILCLVLAATADLRDALPAEAAFVEFVRVRTPAPAYTAFVTTCAGTARVALGDADAIDRVVARWRECLTLGRAGDEFEPYFAAAAYRRVWGPLAKHLPAKASAVWVSPDGSLHRLPWAALRDGTGKMLLERHAVAVVPHETFLRERLPEKRTKAVGKPATLLFGDAGEVGRIAALAKGRRVTTRVGKASDAASLLAELPKAETAHLAVPARFRDGPANSRNPFRRVGLAGVTADDLVGLDLRGTRLVFVGRGEGALGEIADGEGAFGLPRALHIAGARNVVAGLWDAPPGEVVPAFYSNLWARDDPLSLCESLRAAQLAAYRGTGGVRRAPSRDWAAWVLSGTGE